MRYILSIILFIVIAFVLLQFVRGALRRFLAPPPEAGSIGERDRRRRPVSRTRHDHEIDYSRIKDVDYRDADRNRR